MIQFISSSFQRDDHNAGTLKQGWRVLDERTGVGDGSVKYIYEDSRRLLPSENMFRLKLGLCELDVFDSGQKLGHPVPTWCLRITKFCAEWENEVKRLN